MLCQICGTPNADERDFCIRCHTKLLVLSGQADEDLDASDELAIEAQEAFEEHLLERITSLEETVRQLSRAVGSALERLGQAEHELTVTHAGLEALGDLLESHDLISRTELMGGWERSVGRELLSQDLARRFRERAQRILAHPAHPVRATGDFRRQLRALELALVAGDTELAQSRLDDLARLAPENDELWSFIGEMAFETGDLEAAQVAFRRVLQLRGQHYETLIYLGTVLSDLGAWEEAEATLRRALELEPDSFLARFTLGAMEVLRGRHAEALEHLESARELEELPQIWYLLGVSHLQLRHPGRAIAALRRAVELAPNFEDALYQLGLAYLRRGWTQLARDTFQQVLHLDPQRLQYQDTVRLLSLESPSDLPPEAGRLVTRAELALERGHPEAALDLFAVAADVADDEPTLRAAAALLAAGLGRDRDAVAHAHGLLRRPQIAGSPFAAAGVVALLEALRHADRPRAARRLARRILDVTEDSVTRALASYELALVETELGHDLDSARELARAALDMAPKELRHYPLAALGEVALKLGRFREAVQYLEQATSSAPLPVLLQQLAMARLGAGDPDGAEEALEAAQAQPGGGLEEELLGHVRRLGSLLGSLRPHHRPNRNRPSGG